MVGNLLLRVTIPSLKKELKGPVPWDECIEDELLQKWLDYFRMLVALNDIKFPRSYKPNHTDGSVLPTLVTFGNGNPNSFGAVAYAIWGMLDGS